MCLRSIWMTVRGSLSTRFKRRVPLVFEVLGLAFVERFEPENGWFGPNTVFLEAHRIEFDHSEKKREKAGLLPY